MSEKNKMTNEDLSKHFNNPFDLVNHAIGLAHNMVEAGQELTDNSCRNSASLIIRKILKEKHQEESSKKLMELEENYHLADDENFPDPLLDVV